MSVPTGVGQITDQAVSAGLGYGGAKRVYWQFKGTYANVHAPAGFGNANIIARATFTCNNTPPHNPVHNFTRVKQVASVPEGNTDPVVPPNPPTQFDTGLQHYDGMPPVLHSGTYNVVLTLVAQNLSGELVLATKSTDNNGVPLTVTVP